jgi:hypothetical protein
LPPEFITVIVVPDAPIQPFAEPASQPSVAEPVQSSAKAVAGAKAIEKETITVAVRKVKTRRKYLMPYPFVRT